MISNASRWSVRNRRPIQPGEPNVPFTWSLCANLLPAFSPITTMISRKIAAAASTAPIVCQPGPPDHGVSVRGPTYAITLGNEFEISEYNRDDQIYTKDMLLAEPIKKVPVADPALYDTPIPYYRSHS